MTYFELLKEGEKKADEKKIEKTAVKSLLIFASKLPSNKLYLMLNEEAPEETIKAFNEAVDEYTINGKPIDHIIGYSSFYGYEIYVSNKVLIPRWETEELVFNTLMFYDDLFKGKKVDVVDLGTGSGAIAIALKKEEPNMSVDATDISEEALASAKKSAEHNSADIHFSVGSWFEAVGDKKYDIIVSNPPYLTTTEYVEDVVKNNEPHVALYGGEDGLDFYREILKEAPKHVKDRFIIGFENAYNKKKELNAIIKEYFKDAEIVNLKDSAKRNRMTFIIKK